MGFPDLRAFLDQLRRDGDLAVVDAPVDARLEAAEIHRRVIAAGGPALLFTRVHGADFPLATNLFGTRRRAELAFGARPLELVKRIASPGADSCCRRPPASSGGRATCWARPCGSGRARARAGP